MSIGSGLGATFGTGVEATYGTLPAINKWVPWDSTELKLNPVWDKGNGLHGVEGRFDMEVALVQADAAGSIKSNFYYNNMIRQLASLMGGLGMVTPVVNGTTTAYTTTLPYLSGAQGSFSIQEGIPDVAGTVHYWNTLGAIVTDGQFECTNGQALKATFTVDAQDRFEVGSGTAAPNPIPASPFFTWRDMSVKVGAFGSEAKVDGVTKWTGAIKRTMATKRFNAGNLTTNPNVSYAVKDAPVSNGFNDLTGTLETEYLNDTLFENYYSTNSPFSLIVGFTSLVSAGTAFPYSVSFNFPRCRFLTGDQPSVKGPDIVKPTMAYEVLNDGTHPQATITVVSQDQAL